MFFHWQVNNSAIKILKGLVTGGSNSYGQLNRSDITVGTTSYEEGWGNMTTEGSWISAAGGEYTTVLVKSDGTLWGIGGSAGTSTLRLVNAATNWTKVFGRVSESAVLALNSSGALYTVGLGATPTITLKASSGMREAFGGSGFYFAISTSGALYSEGSNTYGQLGKTTTAFGQVGTATNWTKVGCGRDFTVAINSLGQLWGCGRNDQSQLTGVTGNKSTLTRLGTATDWLDVACSSVDSYAIKTDGSIWTWGANAGSTPVLFDNSRQWYSIKAGGSQWMALDSTGHLYGWGSNSFGQLGLTSFGSYSTPTLLIPDEVLFYQPCNQHSVFHII